MDTAISGNRTLPIAMNAVCNESSKFVLNHDQGLFQPQCINHLDGLLPEFQTQSEAADIAVIASPVTKESELACNLIDAEDVFTRSSKKLANHDGGIDASRLSQICQRFRHDALRMHPDKGGTRKGLLAVLVQFSTETERVFGQSATTSRSQCKRKKGYFLETVPRSLLLASRGNSERAHARTRNLAVRHLATALSNTSREQRRLTIESLPTAVRAALAVFMKGCKDTSCSAGLKIDADLRRPMMITQSKAARCSIERVQRGVQVHYRVAKSVPSLNLIVKTQYVSSLEFAIEMCVVLVQVSAEFSARYPRDVARAAHQGSQAVIDDICSTFIAVLHNACIYSRVRFGQLRLSFNANVRLFGSGSGSPTGSWTRDLREAILRGRKLSAACQGGWSCIRSELIHMRMAPTQRRSRFLDLKEASRHVDKACRTVLRFDLGAATKAAKRAFAISRCHGRCDARHTSRARVIKQSIRKRTAWCRMPKSISSQCAEQPKINLASSCQAVSKVHPVISSAFDFVQGF